jgi:hypothetical protein
MMFTAAAVDLVLVARAKRRVTRDGRAQIRAGDDPPITICLASFRDRDEKRQRLPAHRCNSWIQ